MVARCVLAVLVCGIVCGCVWCAHVLCLIVLAVM
jgi:hypothetical protein